jgi:glycosyltransferase involved in cell wall biosynthesis
MASLDSSPAIDIVIPVYNRPEQCQRAVESVLNQSYTNYQLYIIEDGSEQKAYIPKWDKHTQIHYHSLTQNKGVSFARNFGVSQGSSPWVAFLDSDDIWHKQKLELQVQDILQKKALIHQCAETWIRNGVRVNPPARLLKREGVFFKQSLQDCMITPSSVILKRSLFEKYHGFNENLPACEDYDLWLRITADDTPVALLNKELLIRYGGHEDQLSHKYPIMDRFRLESLANLLEDSSLIAANYELALHVFQKKYKILKKGAKKHSNHSLLEYLQSPSICKIAQFLTSKPNN